MVAAVPTTPQAYSFSSYTCTATSTIPEYPTTKGIFAAAGDHMHVPDIAAPRSTDRIIVEIPKSQVAIMAKKGATIVDQGGNYYSMSVVILSPPLA